MHPATGTMRSNKGFTAIEITAVATIIAILALLLIPLLQERVEKAKIAAANNDITQLMKMEMLVFADTNYYARLQDLDNTSTSNDSGTTIVEPDLSVPHAFWNIPMTIGQRDKLKGTVGERGTWQGPYLAFNKFKTIDSLLSSNSAYFWGNAGIGGPILLTKDDDTAKDRYPVDPWGNPYLFYGKGKLYDKDKWDAIGANPTVAPVLADEETDFSNCVIYCTGPDALIGDRQAITPENLRREAGILGTNPDDLMVQF